MMSLKAIAASTSMRRGGCSVISTTCAGSLQVSRMSPVPAQVPIFRQVATRLAHEPHQVRSTLCSRQARRNRSRKGAELGLAVYGAVDPNPAFGSLGLTGRCRDMSGRLDGKRVVVLMAGLGLEFPCP